MRLNSKQLKRNFVKYSRKTKIFVSIKFMTYLVIIPSGNFIINKSVKNERIIEMHQLFWAAQIKALGKYQDGAISFLFSVQELCQYFSNKLISLKNPYSSFHSGVIPDDTRGKRLWTCKESGESLLRRQLKRIRIYFKEDVKPPL